MSVNLANIIQVSRREITKHYVLNSMASLPPEVLTFRNTHNVVEVEVRLAGAGGVRFEPAVFMLNPMSQQDVNVVFDTVEVNKFPEGLSSVNCVMTLSSNTVLITPPTFEPNPEPIPEIEVTPIPGMWFEQRFAGTPSVYGGRLTDAQLFTTPILKVNVPSISFDSRPDETSTIWTRTFDLEAGEYEFVARTDDGMRVYVDGNIVIDAWWDQGDTTYKKVVSLSQGRHIIAVYHYQDRGPAVAHFDFYRYEPKEVPFTPPEMPFPTQPKEVPFTPPEMPPASSGGGGGGRRIRPDEEAEDTDLEFFRRTEYAE